MKPQRQDKRLMGDDPLSSDAILERFYKPVVADAPPASDGSDQKPTSMPTSMKVRPDKPTHYKVVCISLYNEDIEHLERMVAELKRRGHTKANKSQLIRAALAQVDLAKIPKGF
jgi:hypothetical protein